MYAHEIVADLKRLSTVRFGGLNKQGEIELRFLQSFLKLAQESQYFHFGHRTVLAKMFGGFKTINVQEHYVKYKDFIILPYPKMCIEYVQSTVGLESCHDGMLPGNKAAIFVEDIGCQILVRMCTYFPTFRSWSPSVETIAISKDTNEVRSGWLIGHIRPQATDGILDAFTNAICCLTLLNCKNVHAEKVVPPQALQKKRERNGKLPMIGVTCPRRCGRI